MKFLISPATPELIDACGTESLFTSTNGKFYLYEVDYAEDEMITITDSVGRSVPLDITELTALTEVLLRVIRYQNTKEKVQDLMFNELVGGANILP